MEDRINLSMSDPDLVPFIIQVLKFIPFFFQFRLFGIIIFEDHWYDEIGA